MDRVDNTIKGLQYGLWGWYDFSKVENLLWVDGVEQAGSGLKNLPPHIDCPKATETIKADWLHSHMAEYDVVLSIASIEKFENPVSVLSQWKQLLKPSGKILLGMNNRFGLRYFCGDRDPYTMRNFDGIENYHNTFGDREEHFYGRMYSREEIKEMLVKAGLENNHFYSVLPDLENCTLIYAEDNLPSEDLANRLFPMYNYPDTVFLEERELYTGLIKNNMFHQMANAYLVECSLSGECSNVLHVTSSMERGKENAFFTVIRRDGLVEKRPAYYEGKIHLEQMSHNHERLRKRGLHVVDGHWEEDCYVMPHIDGENGLRYLERLMEVDEEKFLEELDRFCDLVLNSSDIEKEETGAGESAILRLGYIDMVPWNSFYLNGEFIFFDQEFCVEHYPVYAVLIRTVGNLQAVAKRRNIKAFSDDILLQRYGLKEKKERWLKLESDFFEKVKNENELCVYHNRYRPNLYEINLNRQRINYSVEHYQKIFVDIFRYADTRKLILFGSGKYANNFIIAYRNDYHVYKIIDNNQERWGDNLYGLEIVSPDILHKLGQDEYKIIICMKNYSSVVKQLEDMGVSEYSIYDANRGYPRQIRHVDQSVVDTDAKPKKYHVGYIAGVFDLFHYGHLNLLRRAKDLCDYLIVGVVSDRQVREGKKVEPFVPFEERLEVVRSCRYVDEANVIPIEDPGTEMAWQLYHFDVQFSGSDYEDDPVWLGKKKWLEERGSTMVFFPYTQSTSSTKLKKLITERLL